LGHYLASMKFQSWKNKAISNRRSPETAITSCAASILVLAYAIALMISLPLQSSHANRQPCTVIIDCVERPIVLHTNSFLHRAFVLTLKGELKFFGNLLHQFA
jgi:hypothetical protein